MTVVLILALAVATAAAVGSSSSSSDFIAVHTGRAPYLRSVPRTGRAGALEPQAATGAARTFYISPTGSDQASGLAPTTAWRTTANVERLLLGPGDAILFEATVHPAPGQLYIDGDKEMTKEWSVGG
jgi:hypothetical protein